MLTCKQVSKALEKQDYETLSPFSKAMLKFHVWWCFVCKRYNKDVMLMQDTCRHARAHDDDCCHRKDKLDDQKKNEIAEAMRRAAE